MIKGILFPVVLCGMILTGSCKKLVDDKKKEILLSMITSGQWHVEEYLEASVDITYQFGNYNFIFSKTGTVSGNNGVTSETGTWAGDIDNYSIHSNFPDAGDPLRKLNGIWMVKDSNDDYVDAEMTTVNGKMILHLRKNP